MSADEGTKILTISASDGDRVIEFLNEHFLRDEPLKMSLEAHDEPVSKSEGFESFCLSPIPEGASFMAVDDDDEILGIAICGLFKRSSPIVPDMFPNSKLQPLDEFFHTVSRNADLFGQCPLVDECLDVRIVSVSPRCRRRGIARKLFDRIKNVALQRGIPMIRVECTNHFTYLAVAKLGYEVIYEIDYKDYLDGDGRPVFSPAEPHRSYKMCVLRLDRDA